MNTIESKVRRLPITLRPDPKRVLLRPFTPSLVVKPVNNLEPNPRIIAIFSRVMMLSEEDANAKLQEVLHEFDARHQDIREIFTERFEQIRPLLPTDRSISESHQLLLGSYFINEYSLESSALFNPSIVLAPDQHGVAAGEARFLLSLRATGEGHISSITFRSGVVTADGNIRMDPVFKFVRQPRPQPISNPQLPGQTDYIVRFEDGLDISEKILFPYTQNERNGIEDARFVRFHNEDGSNSYYATYTAYDGSAVFPQMVTTRDFREFTVNTLSGTAARNKGLALFPRKVDGHYAMLGRQDNENIHIMFSDNLHSWNHSQIIMRPAEPWEFVQLGNCGSPIETDAGWLILTHGVGPMRKYCIGAALLDLHDPTRLIARLRDPLLSPDSDEREGYVPNVVYSCGSMVHAGNLIIPYAISDTASRFAVISLQTLINAMQTC